MTWPSWSVIGRILLQTLSGEALESFTDKETMRGKLCAINVVFNGVIDVVFNDIINVVIDIIKNDVIPESDVRVNLLNRCIDYNLIDVTD